MKSIKERLIIVSIMVLLLCTLTTTAFLSSGGVADNIITFGNLRLQLVNHTINAEGNEVPVEQSNEKLTGTEVSRIIKVRNVCENPMYIRVKIEFKGEDKQGVFQANQYVSLMQSENGWVQAGDWFYYNKVLESEKETTNLLDGLQFDLDRLMTEHAGSSIDFSVYAQAVQSKHNGTSAEKAQGWPQEAVR